MQKIYFWIFLALLAGKAQTSYAQDTGVPAAAFDVMVMNNGDIIYGKVVEVNMHLIRYKRTDIPDGPIYELFKSEVYAISYRNQLTEYLIPQENMFHEGQAKPSVRDSLALGLWRSSAQAGEVRIGVGIVRNYSRVKEVDEYQSEFSFPSIHISYLFPVNSNIDVGLAMGYAGFKYSDKSFSEYDQLQTDRTIRETLFSVALIGKYGFDLKLFRPYVLAGISFTNSNVRTEGTVTFTDDERSILVQGGARSGSFGIPLRGGVDIRIVESFNAFIEAGTGLTMLQVGGVFKIGR